MAKLALLSADELYLATPGLRAARDRNSANTSAKTIPVFTPISIRARLKYSVVFSFSIVRDAPTVRMWRTAAITPIIKKLSRNLVIFTSSLISNSET